MQNARIVFTGHFLEYFIMSLGLLLLSVITFGLALPYYAYWNFKYFFSHMEIEMPVALSQAGSARLVD